MSNLWDKITGSGDDHNKPAGSTSQPHPPVATVSQTQTVPKKDEGHGFSLASLRDALPGGSSHPQPASVPPVPAASGTHTQAKEDDWVHKFTDLLDFGASNKKEAEEERLRLEKERLEKEAAAKKAAEEASFTGKLKGLFKSDEEEEKERERLKAVAEQKRKEAEEAKHKEVSWTAKISAVFDGDSAEKEKERQRLAEEAKKNQTLGARVRNIFGSTPPPPPPEPSLTDRILHPFGGPKPPEPEPGFLDKVTNSFGSGSRSEEREDKLDKAVDYYQEHVLHKGPQKSESWFEQTKDEQISDSIRKGYKNLTGHEFPASDKKH